jgi:hypothetical protein
MPDLTPEEVLEVVDKCVWESLNVKRSKEPDCNVYDFAYGKYNEYVYGLDCFKGLEIKGYDFATHIKMRGHIYVFDTTSPSYNPNYYIQNAYIAICNKDGNALVTLYGNTQQRLFDQFQPLLTSTAVGAVVSPSPSAAAVSPSQWLELVEKVLDQLKAFDARSSDTGVVVSKELLVGILRDILRVLGAKKSRD